MSQLKPDLYEKYGNNPFFISRPNTAVLDDVPPPPVNIPVEEVEIKLHDYGKTYTGEQATLYRYARTSAKITSNNRSFIHYIDLFNTFYIASLKKSFPDKDFDGIEKNLESVKKELAEIIKTDNVDKGLFLACLHGMMEGLL